MGYWSKNPIDRDQIALFSPTLDSWIPEDHPVRLFDEILSTLDWSSWEAQYFGCVGQPPIHPKILAGVILYGLSMGMRSSRSLERVCANSIDFLWLTSGRSIDHSTICKFRTKFGKELKDVFRQIGRVSMTMGLIRLNQVGLDGTSIKANSSRYKTATVTALEQRIAVLDEQVEQIFSEAQAADERDNDMFGSLSSNHLPKELSDLQKRKEALEKALMSARSIEVKRQRRTKPPSKPVEVPVTDPDSAILPNKDGGHAPNYTPMAAVDSHRGFVVDADVTNEGYESLMTVPTVERIEGNFEKVPEKILADSAHGTGPNFQQLEKRGVEAYIPAQNYINETNNPVRRDNPTESVSKSDWDKLPRNHQSKKLDKSAFVYDSSKDCYYCPMGRKLQYVGDFVQSRKWGKVHGRRYHCKCCSDCVLAAECLIGKAKQRSVYHTEFETACQSALKRMLSPEGKKIYSQRKWICETPFAIIKERMKLRQFLLRRLEKVRTEWLWTCTSFNLSKLVREVVRMRAKFSTMLA